ncbi:hypothetical protein HJC23_013980 [Cyclotella cryptica]|uniref:J domain-containing protein n=1 Tax=Cyclotella cryptica TaxID=29204 RepID=A0ABD3Q375_9STRA
MGQHQQNAQGASLNSNFAKLESKLKKKQQATASASQQTKQTTTTEEDKAASRKAQQILTHILKAASQGHYYAVLGMNLAMVHPNKNRDGRAKESFQAIETSVAILMDEEKRKEYDRRLIGNRRRRNGEVVKRVVSVSGWVWHGGVGVVMAGKNGFGAI